MRIPSDPAPVQPSFYSTITGTGRSHLATTNPDQLIRTQEESSSCGCNLFEYLKSLFESFFSFVGSFLFSSSSPINANTQQINDPPSHQDEQLQLLQTCACESSPSISTNLSHRFSNPNKLFAYNQLTANAPSNALDCQFSKYALNDHQTVANSLLFSHQAPAAIHRDTAFLYDASTPAQKHWFPNFADQNLFGYAFGPLLAQDELQVLEHPALYHLKLKLEQEGINRLAGNEIALIEGALRLGHLDMQTPLASGYTLYGNYFAYASQDQIASKLTTFNSPHHSNIFAMAAPHISTHLAHQPYQKDHLEQLFYRAYTAFSAAKEKSGSNCETCVHTGNWGAGAFGNDAKTVALIQLAAARLAQVNLFYYPLNNAHDFVAAQNLLHQIEQENPQLTVDAFLNHLTENASPYQLLYGVGNGT